MQHQGWALRRTEKNRYLQLAWSVTGALLLFNTVTAQAQTPPCGTILTADTTLDSDMTCASTAIQFVGSASDNVTLDCAGFGISTIDESAIIASDVSGISIQNCTISTDVEFAHGIFFTDVTGSSVTDNDISADGDFARGVEMQRSSNNEFADNDILIVGKVSNSLRMRSASNNNLLRGNSLFADAASTVNIQSSNGNILSGNNLFAPGDFVIQNSLLLHSGGMSIDSAGNAYAVENNVGSAITGIGTVTAFIRLDFNLGSIDSVIPVQSGATDVAFGFAALEVLPNGRMLALPDAGTPMDLYEIDPNSDPNSAQVSAIGLNLPPLAGALNGLEATSNSSLLATTNAGELLNIDLTTGDVTPIGQQGKGWMDLAVHPTNGWTYAVSRRIAEATDTNHLYRIDPFTGQIMSEIGDLEQKFISDIDFAPDGTLYGINSGQVVVIDTADATFNQLLSLGPDPLEPFPDNTRLINNLWQAASGNIRFSVNLTLPTQLETRISRQNLKISFNNVMVDTTELPFLDVPARITLHDLPQADRILLVDEDNSGNFETCLSNRCTLVSNTGGDLVFDVTGFSTYSSKTKGGKASDDDSDSDDDDDGYSGAVTPWMLALLFLAVLLRSRRT